MRMNLHKPRIALPTLNVSKRLLLIVAGAALVFCLLTVATVHQVNVERGQKAAAAAQEAQAYEAVRQNTARIQSLQDQLKTSEAKRKAVCDYTLDLSKAPATRGRVTTPAMACQ